MSWRLIYSRFAKMYKEKLLAECEGREWTPISIDLTSTQNTASLTTSERTAAQKITFPDKKANEDYFEVYSMLLSIIANSV